MNITYLQRSPGIWRLRIETGKDKAGKRLFKYETVHGTEDEAARRRYAIMTAHDEGTWAEPSKVTVAQFLTKWVAQRQALGKIGRSTAENYTTLFDSYVVPTLGGKRLQALTGAELQALYTDLLTGGQRNGKPLKASSVALLHSVLGTAFRGARRAKLVKVNPMEEVEGPSGKRPVPKALDAAGVEKFMAGVAGTWLYPLCVVGLGAGLRRGEIAGLRRCDVDLARGKLHVRGEIVQYRDGSTEWKAPKTDNGIRSVSIAREIVDMLREVMRAGLEQRMKLGLGNDGLAEAYVFTNPRTGELIKPNKITNDIRKLCDNLGMPEFSFHGTRHTHITVLLRKVGRSGAKLVSERVGHADITTTLRVYDKVFDEDDAELGELAAGLVGRVQNVPGKPK